VGGKLIVNKIKRPSPEVLAQVHSLHHAQGKIAAIDPDTGEWFLGKDLLDAVRKGRTKYPDHIFYTVRIGSPYAHEHKGEIKKP